MGENDDEAGEVSDADGSGRGRGRGRLLRAGAPVGTGDAGVQGRGVVVVTRDPMAVRPAEFEHERLIVYRVARDAFVLAARWWKRKMPGEIRDQLQRSMASLLWNIAEGAGKTSRPDKRRFYEIAKGSATEAAAQLEIIHLLGAITEAEYAEIRPLLLRTAKMLAGLCGPPRAAMP